MLVEIDAKSLTKKKATFQPTTFQGLNLKESDLEEFLRNNIDVLFTSENAQGDANESLLIVGQQAINSQGGRADLIAVDGNGFLTIIEIKRDAADIKQRKEPFEFQAIRYTASLAKIKTPEQLVELVYTPYVERHRGKPEFDKYSGLTASEIATRELNGFLSQNKALGTFNQKQRVVLVASTFDAQTLSAVSWLITNGVNIVCFTLTPGELLTHHFISVDKLLPPPLLEEFYVELRAAALPGKTQPTKAVGGKQNLPRIADLVAAKLLDLGDTLSIKGRTDSQAEVINPSQVKFQGKAMLFNEWGKLLTGWSSINIYDHAENAQGKTLGQLRLQLSEKRDKQSQIELEDNDPNNGTVADPADEPLSLG